MEEKSIGYGYDVSDDTGCHVCHIPWREKKAEKPIEKKEDPIPEDSVPDTDNEEANF